MLSLEEWLKTEEIINERKKKTPKDGDILNLDALIKIEHKIYNFDDRNVLRWLYYFDNGTNEPEVVIIPKKLHEQIKALVKEYNNPRLKVKIRVIGEGRQKQYTALPILNDQKNNGDQNEQ